MNSGQHSDVRDARCPHADLVARVAPAVCQIVHCPRRGEAHPIGTGALIRTGAGVVILTAGHVLENTTGVLKALFNYERLEDGGLAPTTEWRLVIAEHWVDGLDYGLAVACDEPGVPPPQNVFDPLEIGSSDALEPGEPLLCIHHPNGEPKQCSTGTFVAFADSELRYHLFTGAKSSGAPLVSLRGELVAVHRAELALDPAAAKVGTAIDEICRTSPGLRRAHHRAGVTPKSSNAAHPRSEIFSSRK